MSLHSASAASLPKSISTVLFDVGNTLHHLDHELVAATISRRARTVTGHEVAVAEYNAKAAVDAQLRARREGTDEVRRGSYFQSILETLSVPASTWEEIGAELRAEDQRQSLWRVMAPETPEVIEQLGRRGFTLGVISNADGRVPAALQASGIAEHFTVVLDSHLVGVEKPDPRIFYLALEACGTSSHETVYVGDIYEIDVQGARGAGITPILLDPLGGYGEVDCLRIDRLSRLLDLLPLSPTETSE